MKSTAAAAKTPASTRATEAAPPDDSHELAWTVLHNVHWLQRQHIDLKDFWDHIDFQVMAIYDVVAAPGWHMATRSQPWGEFWYIRSGTVEVAQGGASELAGPGDVVLLASGRPRDTRHVHGPSLSILGFGFHATLLGAIDFVPLLDLPIVAHGQSETIVTLVTRMLQESTAREAGYTFAIQGLGQLALVELIRSAQGAPESSLQARQRLQAAQTSDLGPVLAYVATHFDAPLNVAALAEIAHLSTKHFARKFRDALGLTPMEYLRRFRLLRARDLLGSSDSSVGAIARRCGFEDAGHFTRCYRREFGYTPVEFRRRLRVGDYGTGT